MSKQPLTIAIIGQKGVPATWGGVEQHVDNLVQQLDQYGHSVVVYARGYYTTEADAVSYEARLKRVQVVLRRSLRTKHFDTITHVLFSTLDAIRRDVDIYHFQGVGPSLLSWIPRMLRPRATVINTFHCTDREHQKWGLLARLMLTLGERAAVSFSHETITISQFLQRYCQEHYKTATHYIPNGVHLPQLLRPSQITAQFGLHGGDYILSVSRLVRHKGIHHLIAAYKQIPTNLKLVIVGDSSHTDDYVAELKELAQGDSRILFTGYQTGKMLTELYSNAALLVQPSESEGLSIALLESASYGLPIVASDIPANTEVLQGFGRLFASGVSEDLRVQLQSVLKDPHQLIEDGKQARKHIAENYDWENIGAATVALYEATVKAPRHQPLAQTKQA